MPNSVRLAGRETFWREEQNENASFPKCTKPSGRAASVTFVRVESLLPDALQAFRERDAGNIAALEEGFVTDALEALRQGDLRERGVVTEGRRGDLPNPVRNDNRGIVPLIKQQKIVENSHTVGEVLVPRSVVEDVFSQPGDSSGEGNGREIVAAVKRIVADFVQAARQSNRDQAGIQKRVGPDFGQAVRQVDCHKRSVHESIVVDLFQAVGKDNVLQCLALKGIGADANNALRHREFRDPGAFEGEIRNFRQRAGEFDGG